MLDLVLRPLPTAAGSTLALTSSAWGCGCGDCGRTPSLVGSGNGCNSPPLGDWFTRGKGNTVTPARPDPILSSATARQPACIRYPGEISAVARLPSALANTPCQANLITRIPMRRQCRLRVAVVRHAVVVQCGLRH
jgi:hypothetical protein